MAELKEKHTVVIVTHNMQQADVFQTARPFFFAG